MQTQGVAVPGQSYIVYNSVLYVGEPTYNTHHPHNAHYNWVSQREYPNRQTINITQVQEFTLSVANMPLALHLIGSLFKIQ